MGILSATLARDNIRHSKLPFLISSRISFPEMLDPDDLVSVLMEQATIGLMSTDRMLSGACLTCLW